MIIKLCKRFFRLLPCIFFFFFARQLVRINLSEQTDVSDLFGSDLPVPDSEKSESSEVGGASASANARFAWCDGVFLRALKAGKWVLLDELNLASQVRQPIQVRHVNDKLCR